MEGNEPITLKVSLKDFVFTISSVSDLMKSIKPTARAINKNHFEEKLTVEEKASIGALIYVLASCLLCIAICVLVFCLN